MAEQVYRVVSVQTTEDETGVRKVARMVMEDGTGEVSICVERAKPGDRFKISADRLSRLHFLHHHDRTNQGDVLSGPYHYFDFGPYEKMSWDAEILKRGPQKFATDDHVIMGGGIYFFRDKPRFEDLAKRAKHLIGWGLGLDERLELKDFVAKFSLMGTRDRQTPYIDGDRVVYVPCASCMHTSFDRTDFLSGETRSVAVHINGGFNAAQLRSRMGEQPATTTVSPFTEIIQNLMSAETVVTNSYHGAYWGSLMGKKVVCLKTEVAKWDGLHGGIQFADAENVEEAIRRAERIPASYREECRSLNEAFAKRVRALVAD